MLLEANLKTYKDTINGQNVLFKQDITIKEQVNKKINQKINGQAVKRASGEKKSAQGVVWKWKIGKQADEKIVWKVPESAKEIIEVE